jgi:hypothetical protein
MLASRHTKRNDEWVDYPDGRHVLLDTLKTPLFDGHGKPGYHRPRVRGRKGRLTSGRTRTLAQFAPLSRPVNRYIYAKNLPFQNCMYPQHMQALRDPPEVVISYCQSKFYPALR